MSLRRKLEDEGAIFHSNSDTEVLMHLIRRSSKPTFMDKLKEALNTVHGGFAYLIMTEDAMIGALDPNGFRPLSLGKMKNGAYVLASETCALDVVGAELVRNIRPGEIIVVNDHGYKIVQYTNKTQLAICSMEYIYFARPDSNIYGVNVHSARKRMGARLAEESPVDATWSSACPTRRCPPRPVTPRPRTCPTKWADQEPVCGPHLHPTHAGAARAGRAHETVRRPRCRARQARHRHRRFDRARNHVQAHRPAAQGGRRRRSAHAHQLAAAQIPCFYGIDISTTKELIAAKKSVEEIRDFIGADSLAFLSLDGLVESIGLNAQAPYGGLCVAYFNGDYPTALDDYETDFLKSLTPEDRVRLPEFALYKSKYEGNEYTTAPTQQ